MNWKFFIHGLRQWLLIVYRQSLQEESIKLFIPGKYRRDWKNTKADYVELVTISSLSELSDIYTVTTVTSKLVIHNEQMVYTKQPEEFHAFYDARTRRLLELSGFNSYSFLPESGQAIFNKEIFRKLKPEA